jgi:hypothetical protein
MMTGCFGSHLPTPAEGLENGERFHELRLMSLTLENEQELSGEESFKRPQAWGKRTEG